MRYLPFQVRKIPHLPNSYIQILNNLNKELALQEIIRDRVTLPKLLTTLIHGSAVYAGNNYDVFAVENLLSTGKPNSKHTFMEALMIVNLKEAVDYTLNIVNKDITVEHISEIHFHLTKGLTDKDMGCPIYTPDDKRDLEEIVNISRTIQDPFVKAIYLELNLYRFNKCMARLVQFHSLFNSNRVPLVSSHYTITGLEDSIMYYISHLNSSEYTKWFMSSYLEMFRKLIGHNKINLLSEGLDLI